MLWQWHETLSVENAVKTKEVSVGLMYDANTGKGDVFGCMSGGMLLTEFHLLVKETNENETCIESVMFLKTYRSLFGTQAIPVRLEFCGRA
jgi:hypothetical protein